MGITMARRRMSDKKKTKKLSETPKEDKKEKVEYGTKRPTKTRNN